jgi:tetratricopeptide (TPR) repeat protein
MKRYIMCATVCMIFFGAGLHHAQPQEKNAFYYFSQGQTRFEKGLHRQALFSYRNALARNPRYDNALLGLARCYHELDMPAEAAELYDRVLKHDSSNSEALVGAGMVYIRMGRHKQAMHSFEKALAESEENLEAHYGMAALYDAMEKQLWAKRKLTTILRINPFHLKSMLLMGDILAREDDAAGARELIEKAMGAYGENPAAYVKLAEISLRNFLIHENRNDLGEAHNALRSALAIQNRHIAANMLMGHLYYFTNDYAAAIIHYNRVLKETESASVLYSLAISYDALNNEKQSLEYFARAMKKSPLDSILQRRTEQFLLFHDYKIGHPLRHMYTGRNYEAAQKTAQQNLVDEHIMYLRRTLLLNPLNRQAREDLMEIYSARNYSRFYIGELKEMMKLYPENGLKRSSHRSCGEAS